MADAQTTPVLQGQIPVPDWIPAEEGGGECELFGLFGIFIQFILAVICTSSLLGKWIDR